MLFNSWFFCSRNTVSVMIFRWGYLYRTRCVKRVPLADPKVLPKQLDVSHMLTNGVSRFINTGPGRRPLL